MTRFGIVIAIAGAIFMPTAVTAQADYKGETLAPAVGTRDSFFGTKLIVSDLDAAVRFYSQGLAMKQVGTLAMQDKKEALLKFDGNGEPTLMLIEYHGGGPITVGSAYGQLVFMTTDVDGVFARMKAAGFNVTQAPQISPNQSTKVLQALDPDGHPVEVVQIMKK